MLELQRLLFMLKMIMQHILIVLVLNIFLKKSKYEQVRKLLFQIFHTEYKHMIHNCCDTFTKEKTVDYQTLLIHFHQDN